MSTKELRRIVQELKAVEPAKWNFSNNQGLASYNCSPDVKAVNVCCRADDRGRPYYFMEVNASGKNLATYRGREVKDLYPHLEDKVK